MEKNKRFDTNKFFQALRKLDLGKSRSFYAFLGVFILSFVLSIISPHFLTMSNILNVLRQVSIIAIISIGMTLVIILGGIDLSVGSTLAFSSMCMAVLMKNGVNVYFAIIAGIVIGALLGLFSSYLITGWIQAPAFISTLSTMSISRGLTLIISGGAPIFGLPEEFGFFGGGYLFNIPIPIIIMILAYIVSHIYLMYSIEGTYIFAVGGNPEAARLSGINVKKMTFKVYVISGITAAIAGVILSSRLLSIEPLAGLSYELDAIASAVIGGANLMGGEGSLIGTFMGALIMGILRNGLNLLNVSTFWQQVVVGFVIIATVAIGTIRKN